MISISEKVSLKPFHTFGLEVETRYFTTIHSIQDLEEAIQFVKNKKIPYIILGGGSNVFFRKNYDGLVIRNSITGKEVHQLNNDDYLIKANSGENWHDF